MSTKHYRIFAGMAGLIIIADQIVKAIVLKTVPLYHSIPVVPGFFNITHIHNPGGAFGFLAGNSSSLRFVLFTCASVAAIGIVFYFYAKLPSGYAWLRAALTLIFAGAIGNLIDRLRFREVIDFLDFYIGGLHYPAFNIADSAITIGILIFIYHILFNKLPA